MEIFFIIILIVMVVMFYTGHNSRLGDLRETLKSLDAHIKLLNRKLSEQSEEMAKSKTVSPPPVSPVNPFSQGSGFERHEEKKEEPPKPLEEIKLPPIADAVPPPVKDEDNEIPEKSPEQLIPDEELEAMSMAYGAAENDDPKPEPPPPPPPRRKVQVEEPTEDFYTRFRKNNPDLEKFIGENILSKVAITILVLGIAFFVKYAIDKNWINEVARVGIGMLAGGIVLGFAHRLRARFKAFSSVLVAGGISIFYFTIGIGFHEYHVFGQTVAFSLMLVITAFSVFISVAYDRIELAVLSIIGGFATPFMVSTGSGNYQVLFTYILILDVGMLVLAYLRKWNLVNILTYVFTILIYLSWLESRVIHKAGAPYMGALLFGAAFYIVFILMNIVNNIKAKREFAAIEISILLSNTFIFYGCGMQILDKFHPEWRGIFSIAMAITNMICAWLLYKKFKADMKLVYMLIGLTLTFVTIAVPVQLEGNYITMVWALESVLLMWLGIRSGFVIYRFSSVLIMAFMLMSLGQDWTQIYGSYTKQELKVLINQGFITGIVSAFSLMTTVFLLSQEIKKQGDRDHMVQWLSINFHPRYYSAVLRVLAVCVLYLAGILELGYQLGEHLPVKQAYYIVMMCYHLLFLCALSLKFPKYKHHDLNTIMFYVNGLTVIIYALCFTVLPLSDFRENMMKLQTNYTGFIFHYISLAAALFLSIRIYRAKKQEGPVVMSNPLLFTCLLVAVITFVCSLELILHIAHLRVGYVGALTAVQEYQTSDEYNTMQRHVIKAGFPILWGLLSFAFLFYGMKKHYQTFRVAALLLIGITVLKLFIYDIRSTSEGGKILAFIILGVVLLIISFMYQKIKALIIEGRPGNENPPAS